MRADRSGKYAELKEHKEYKNDNDVVGGLIELIESRNTESIGINQLVAIVSGLNIANSTKSDIFRNWLVNGNKCTIAQLQEKILPLFGDDNKIKSEFIGYFPEVTALTVSELQQILPLQIEKPAQIEMLKFWFVKNPEKATVEALKLLLPLVTWGGIFHVYGGFSHSYKTYTIELDIIKGLIISSNPRKMPTNILVHLMRSVIGDSRFFSQTSFLRQRTCINIVRFWLENNPGKVPLAELTTVLSLFDDGETFSQNTWSGIISSWLEMNPRQVVVEAFNLGLPELYGSCDYIKEVVAAFEKYLPEFYAIEDCMRDAFVAALIRTNPGKINVVVLERLFLLIGNDYNKFGKIKRKAELIKCWIETNPDQVTVRELEKLLPLADQQWNQSTLIHVFHKWNNSKVTIEDFLPLLELITNRKYSGVDRRKSSEVDARYLVHFWLRDNPKARLEELKILLDFVYLDSAKNIYLGQWVSQNPEATFSQLVEVANLSTDKNFKTEVAINLLQNRSISTLEEFRQILPLFSLIRDKTVNKLNLMVNKSDSDKLKIIDNLNKFIGDLKLENRREDDGGIKELREIIVILILYFNESIKYEAFIRCAKTHLLTDSFDVQEISKKWQEIYPSNQGLGREEILKLCKDLYPDDEDMQCDLFCQFIDSNYFKQIHKPILCKFLESLQDDDFVFQVFNHVKRRAVGRAVVSGFNITEKEFLKICSSRVHSKCESIADVLEKFSLAKALTDSGQKKIKSLFGDDVFRDGANILALASDKEEKKLEIKDQGQDRLAQNQSVTLAALFTYYSIYNRLRAFKELLKPEILAQIKFLFKPTDSKAFVLLEEAENIEDLFGNDFQLPKVEILGDFLKSKIKVPSLNIEEIDNYRMNFQGSSWENQSGKLENKADESNITEVKVREVKVREEKIREEKIREVKIPEVETKETITDKSQVKLAQSETTAEALNATFIKLLKQENPDDVEVVKFFKEICNIDTDINDDDKIKLIDLFRDNKNEFAYIFSQPNGIFDLSLRMTGLHTGCVANIATQVRIGMYLMLLKDDVRSLPLLICYLDKIANPILNRGGDHLGGSAQGLEMLVDEEVVEHCISMPGLIKELTKNTAMIREVEVVADFVDVDKEAMYRVLTYVIPEGVVYDRAAAVELAVYCLIKATTPELLDSKYIRAFVTKNSELLQKLQEKVLYEERGQERQHKTTLTAIDVALPGAVDERRMTGALERVLAKEVKTLDMGAMVKKIIDGGLLRKQNYKEQKDFQYMLSQSRTLSGKSWEI